MAQYNDQKWLTEQTTQPIATSHGITITDGEVAALRQELAVLHREVSSVSRELSALIEVIKETCRAGEANRQAMPPKLAEWWRAHK